jgi:hypothetical protein
MGHHSGNVYLLCGSNLYLEAQTCAEWGIEASVQHDYDGNQYRARLEHCERVQGYSVEYKMGDTEQPKTQSR